MPLIQGKSKKAISENISEFHKGKTYQHTEAKFGKKKANAQAIAVALSEARKVGAKIPKKKKPKRRYSSEAVSKARMMMS